MTPLQRCQLLAAFLLLCTQFATHLFVEADVLSTTNVQTPVLRWERVDIPPNAPKPSPRKDFVFVFDEQKQSGVLFGGRTSDGNVLDDTWILDIQGRRWTQIDKPIRPPARFGAVAAADQPDTSNRRSIVIFGGKGPNGEIYNDVWGFDTTDSLWYPTKPKGQSPPPMYGAIGGIAPRAPGQEEKLRLLATYGSDDKNLFTDTWVLTLTGQAINYTTVDAEWTKISTSEARPTARTSFGGTVLPGDRVLLYGGCVKGGWGNCPNNEAWVLSPNGVSLTTEGGWKRLDSCPRPRLNAAITHRPDYNTGKPRAQAFMFGGFYSRGSGNPGEVSFIDADLHGPIYFLFPTITNIQNNDQGLDLSPKPVTT
ncbi:hypothetical protein BKA69DRAFT_615138 [Paraphysoderma sedebokerense]|nr:hypothetical protein BKA69DRAFT_615138 [Paraphysoderma sedebokerense]